MYKDDYKTPYWDSIFNIREKPLPSEKYNRTIYYNKPREVDQTNDYEVRRAMYPVTTPHQYIIEKTQDTTDFFLEDEEEIASAIH